MNRPSGQEPGAALYEATKVVHSSRQDVIVAAMLGQKAKRRSVRARLVLGARMPPG